MRTFAQKPKATQQSTSAKSTIPDRAHFGQNHEVNSILHLQRSIGNQAVERLLQAQPEGLEVSSGTTARFAHDFSQISVHAKSPASVQAKLTVSPPGDIYEQEADRISEQVIRMPEPQLHRAAACAGGFPRSQTEQPDEGQDRSETRRIGSSDLRQSAIPPIVHEVLRSPGRSLDSAVRAFMEPRFGHDFSQVRVHTDAKAAESAGAINSLAYTAGRDLVFGEGQYAPGTPDGGRLLAHELTHVVQQGAFGQVEPTFIARPSDRFEREADDVSTAITNPGLPPVGAWSPPIEALANPLMPGGVIQRKPAPDVGAVRKDEARLAELARDPREAHRAWKKLNTEDRFIVLDRMARRYGAAFAVQFLEVAQHGRPEFSVTTWQPRSGPTPERLKAGGWRFLGMEVTGSGAIDVEIWVNPSGNTIRRDVSTYQFGQTEKKEELPKSQKPPDKVDEVDEVAKLRKKWQDISKRLWPALEAYEDIIARDESDPPGKDPARREAHIATYNTAADLIAELKKLLKQAQGVDKRLADDIRNDWQAAESYMDEILR